MIGKIGASGPRITVFMKDLQDLVEVGEARGRFLDYNQPTIKLLIGERTPSRTGATIRTMPERATPDARSEYTIELSSNNFLRLWENPALVLENTPVGRLALHYVIADPDPSSLLLGFRHYT